MPDLIAKEKKVQAALADLAADAAKLNRTVRIMEVGTGHTVAIQRAGIRALLPENVRLISGPGCPICTTPTGYIDGAIALAKRQNVLIATYEDMLRVPGTESSLAHARDDGARVQAVSSAFEAHRLANHNPDQPVVFAAVGFEASAPTTADVLTRARNAGLRNLFVLSAHKLIVPAMEHVAADNVNRIDAFLCPGNLSVMTGYRAYEPIVARHRRPCVIAGFDPPQIIEAVARIVAQLADNDARVENVYTAAVGPDGYARAWEMIERVFRVESAEWRGFGTIPNSGLATNDTYKRFDAAQAFGIDLQGTGERPGCRCAYVITGHIDPPECPLFGRACTPEHPVGTCMVSTGGACHAWYKYRG